jgi:hypothetical protein
MHATAGRYVAYTNTIPAEDATRLTFLLV